MNKLFKGILSVFTLSLSLTTFGQFPGCPSVDAGTNIIMECSQTCTDLHIDLLEIGETTSYEVTSIPYNPPHPFTGSGSSTSISTDDVWSQVIPLGFDFCFFGNTYDKALVGSNGVISFSIAGQVPGGRYTPGINSGWSYTNTIPSNSSGTSLPYVDAIMGVMQDTYPNNSYFNDWSINFEVVGEYPCRQLVVNFYRLGQYNCGASVGPQTYQMVIYETTNVIDVYVQDRKACTNWNSGSGLIGIQNADGSVAYWPTSPNRNTGTWEAHNEAWRFTPNGASTYSVEWQDAEGNVVAEGTDVTICPPTNQGPVTYTAVATYFPCAGGDAVVVTDDVVITPNPNAPLMDVTNLTPATCSASDGGFTVHAENGAEPYTYNIDGGSEQPSGTFNNLPSGTYVVTATDATGCFGTAEVTVEENNPVNISLENMPISCYGSADASATFEVTGGIEPYMYDLNGSQQTSGTFINLDEGSYHFIITDSQGCSRDTVLQIENPEQIDFSVTEFENISCWGYNDGSITVHVNGGSGPFTYSYNGGESIDTEFNDSLYAGEYSIVVTDANGCTETITHELFQPDPYVTSISSIDSACAEGTTQVIIDSGVTDGIFSTYPDSLIISSSSGLINLGNSSPGDYFIIYSFEEDGCAYQDSIPFTVMYPPAIITPILICEGGSWIPQDGPNATYTWSDGIEAGTPVQGELGTQVFHVSAIGDNGCSAEGDVTVITNPNPNTVIIAEPSEGVIPLEVDYTIDNNEGVIYYWDFGNGSVDTLFSTSPGSITVSSVYPQDGEFTTTLHVVNEYGCEGIGQVTIVALYPEIIFEIPNVFTPNGDGANKEFLFNNVNPEYVAGFEISILNRWGQVVFESNDVQFRWNGNTQNTKMKCEDGVYFYKAIFTDLFGKEIPVHGFVHLVR